MTLSTTFALFAAMVLLAITPGPGIVVVVARTLSTNLRHGCITIAGVVMGDFVYIAAVLLGLATLSSTHEEVFNAVKYLGSAYLIGLGISSFINARKRFSETAYKASTLDQNHHLTPEFAKAHRYIASFAIGLFTTLSNPKVIFFYLSFLPAFLNLEQLTVFDVGILLTSITLAVGGVMFGYAYLAHKTQNQARTPRLNLAFHYTSAALLVACGLFVAVR